MSHNASKEILPAIYQRLSPNGALDSELANYGFTGVFDWRAVPESQPFDYVTVGDVREKPKNTFGDRGYIATVTLQFWSRQEGSQALDNAMSRASDLLDQQPLQLATMRHVYTMINQTIRTADPDGLTLHGAVSYDIYVEE